MRWRPASRSAPRPASPARTSRSRRWPCSWRPEFLGDLSDRRVLVIGAGDNAELTARALRDRGVHTLFVANRRYDRALGLAQRRGGRAVTFEDMPRELEAADIVVTSTGAPHQIVGRDELEFVAASRLGRPLVLIDLAVPRDIEPSVRDAPASPSTTWTTCRRPWPATSTPAKARPRRRALALVREGRALRGLDGEPRRRAHDLGAARARRRGRPAGAGRERVALGVPLGRRSRARRGDGAGGRLATPARAHRQAQEPRLLPLPARCASCSGWIRRRPRSRRPPRSPRSTHAAAGGGDPTRNPRQRAGAGAGTLGGRAARRPTGADHRRPPAIAAPAATRRASSRSSSRRCSRARSTWRCTPPRTCPPACPTGWRSAACPSADPRDLLCGAGSLAELAEGAVVTMTCAARRTAGPAPRPGAARPTRQRRHATGAARRRRLRRDRGGPGGAPAPRPGG